MSDKPSASATSPVTPKPVGAVVAAAPVAPRRPPNRGDMRDAMAELTERAQIISQEAGTRIASAMRDVISAGAGIAGFAIESARDLVQFMVRRGQMTQEEADRLIREAEDAHARRPASERARATASKIAAEKAAKSRAESGARNAAAAAAYQNEMRSRQLEAAAKAKAASRSGRGSKTAKDALAKAATVPPKPAAKAGKPATKATKVATNGSRPAGEATRPATNGSRPAAKARKPAANASKPAPKTIKPAKTTAKTAAKKRR